MTVLANQARQSNARAERRRAWGLLALALLTVTAWQFCFAPLDVAPLAYVVLVPWALMVCLPRQDRTALGWGWATGLVAVAVGLYWLTWITLLGYVLLSLYMSFYWLVAAWAVRRAAAQRRALWLVLPVVWTALEYVRSTFASGFPWFSLSHSQYRWTMLVQIADVTGPYGVSFFVAMVNGLILDVILHRQRAGLPPRDTSGLAAPAGPPAWRRVPVRVFRAAPAGWIITMLVAVLLLGYGALRLWQAQRSTAPGPRIGVVQAAFPISLFHPEAGEQKIFYDHLALMRELPLEQLDLVVWPESMLPGLLLDEEWFGILPALQRKAADDPAMAELLEWREPARAELAALLKSSGVQLLAGAGTIRANFSPVGDARWERYNSAVLVEADARRGLRVVDAYDKMHCVPASEYVPFAKQWPWLHRMLRQLIPETMPQLTPGEVVQRFQVGRVGLPAVRMYRLQDAGRPWTVATPICYEGVFSQVCRRLVYDPKAGPPADVLVNISNDGWFIAQLPNRQWASSELDQHLASYVFRAIENRRPVVRAVNTGISGFIDSSGRFSRLLRHEQTGLTKMITGVAEMQVLVDKRRSLYSRIGDAPAQACLAAFAFTAVALWRWHRLGKRKQ